jgi:hypothetical protein
LIALLGHLKRKEERGFLENARAGMKDWWELMEERGTRKDTPMKPQVVAWELGKRLSPTAIVSSDSGRGSRRHVRFLCEPYRVGCSDRRATHATRFTPGRKCAASAACRRTPKEFFNTLLYLARDENLRDQHCHGSRHSRLREYATTFSHRRTQ